MSPWEPAETRVLPLPVAAHVGVLRVQGKGHPQEEEDSQASLRERHGDPVRENQGMMSFCHLSQSLFGTEPSPPKWGRGLLSEVSITMV